MLSLNDVTIRQGQFSLQGLSLDVPTGKYAVLMGRTGSGKTTVLETICGLRATAAGTIRLLGRDVTHLKPALRGVGYVPQDASLFARLTVRQHLAFALVIRGWESRRIAERVAELAELLQIRHLLERRPRGLSGGEAQRVALGRALAMRPGVLLLDEPLSALDAETRQEMYDLLRAVRRQSGTTVLHVTHSRTEAETLADVLLELRDGAVQCVRTGPEAPSPDAVPGTPRPGG